MEAESLGHILVLGALSALLHSLSGEQTQATSRVWCGAPFHLTWYFVQLLFNKVNPQQWQIRRSPLAGSCFLQEYLLFQAGQIRLMLVFT